MPDDRGPEANPLAELLGGKGQAIDASVPSVAFVAVWLAADALGWPQSVLAGGIAAVVVAGGVALWRHRRGERPRAVAVGLLLAVGAALLALYTGRAQDFFLPRIIANAGSLAAWLVSIAIRWPLLGLVVGALTGHPTLWRRDPDLVRGYCRASWVWVAQYAVRVVVFTGALGGRPGRRAGDRPGGADLAARRGVHRSVVAVGSLGPAARAPGAPAPRRPRVVSRSDQRLGRAVETQIVRG